MRRIESDDEFRDRCRLGSRYIYNDFAGRGSGGDEYNVLHRAGCAALHEANVNVPKYFADTFDAARAWLYGMRGAEGTGWKRCEICEPDW